MRATRILLLSSLTVLALGKPSAGETIEDLVRQLGDDSFPVREQATRELIAREISLDEIKRLLLTSDSPEVNRRLRQVMDGKLATTGWSKLKPDEIATKAVPCGHELDGEKTYLVRAKLDGEVFIGKYHAPWTGGNFPVGESERMIPDFETWTGHGQWKSHQPRTKGMIPMGLTRDGRMVYAARAEFNDGLHPGTYIEGEKSARIPWGGQVHRLEDFEVLTKAPGK